MTIIISAVICTRDRAESLRGALKSLAEQTFPKVYYEILVVDNASCDNTKKIVCEEFKFLKNLAYYYEAVPGISRARNKGWINAKGKYVCYLDDDEIASPDWLEKISEAFKAFGPRLCLIGGRIDPIWESPRPLWLSKKIECYISIINHSDSELFLNLSGYYASSGNMAIPKALLEEVGGFNNNFLRGEDTLLQMELMLRGRVCLYRPEILVKHHIQRHRIKRSYFIQLAFTGGVLRAMMIMHLTLLPLSERVKRAAITALKLLKRPGELLDVMIHFNDPKKFHMVCQIMFNIGNIMGFLGMKRLYKSR